jgi:hypothetical protein
LEIRTAPQSTVLYIKKSTSQPGFWGLTRNQIERLRASGVRWFAVFLTSHRPLGYLLTGGQVQERVRDGMFEISKDGDYKVNEHTDFVPAQHVGTLSDLVSRIL